MSTPRRDVGSRLDRVYEQYVKPVEQDQLGEYVLATPTGEMIFAASLDELFDKTDGMDDRDNCIFKGGEIAVATPLTPRLLGPLDPLSEPRR